jgi:hypothetical protein
MLARLTLLLIAIPALALAADDAAPPSGRLRLPQKPAARAPSVQPAATLPVIRPPAPAKRAADGGECRMGCAQTYYFCRAGDHVDDCAGAWGQCVVTCDSPSLTPGYSTAP